MILHCEKPLKLFDSKYEIKYLIVSNILQCLIPINCPRNNGFSCVKDYINLILNKLLAHTVLVWPPLLFTMQCHYLLNKHF